MKLYSIKQGTPGIVLTKGDVLGVYATRAWTTTKHLSFFDTVVDPIRLQNNPDMTETQLTKLARKGFSIFTPEEGGGKYLLAVEYSLVNVD